MALWTVAHQAPLSIGFSGQEYWSGLSCLLQGIFSTQGLNLCLLCLLHRQAGSSTTWKPPCSLTRNQTWVLCTGSAESEPLDHHGSPSTLFISLHSHKSRSLHSINDPILNWVRIPVLHLTVYGSLDKLLNSSDPRWSHL